MRVVVQGDSGVEACCRTNIMIRVVVRGVCCDGACFRV